MHQKYPMNGIYGCIILSDVKKDLNNSKKYIWQKPHLSNQTGTDNAYHPKKNNNENYKKYKSWKELKIL